VDSIINGATVRDGLSIREQFLTLIANSTFPCLGARAALNSGSCDLHVYDELAGPACAKLLACDLERFQKSEMRQRAEYATFVALFRQPRTTSEEQFEKLLWAQLQQLHEIDVRSHDWDPSVSSDPADPHFSFSFAGKAHYVVGMHPNSSRLARRFSWPALVFNPHEQFERLRHDEKWVQMQRAIRSREIALQGNVNPMLSEFGEISEARQYAGRAVDEHWRPPFQQEHSNKSDSASRCPFAS
jgi:uncharacterized protein